MIVICSSTSDGMPTGASGTATPEKSLATMF